MDLKSSRSALSLGSTQSKILLCSWHLIALSQLYFKSYVCHCLELDLYALLSVTVFSQGHLAHPPVTLCDLRLTKIVAEKLNQHKFFPPPSNIVARREEFSHTLIARPVR